MTSQQVNDTVISLLEAKGYHPSVGRAFCMGLEKSARFSEIREIVCGIYKKRVFMPTSQADLDNPSRTHATRRRIIKREHKAKFYPPYRMDRREVLLFSARYPEVEVIHKAAKQDNPHAFHANSRHVATEILLGYVREHATVHDLDANSLIDVGGNEVYHQSRGRDVHCDTPILSARDRARYLHREIYGGSSKVLRCTQTFMECSHSAQFAISVHSCYDMTPLDIAKAMQRRGIRAFYGVLVIPTALNNMMDGKYSCDGTDVTIDGESVSFEFPYDASARYTHTKHAISQYLVTRGTLELNSYTRYSYRVISIRGDTIFFSVLPIASDERVHGPSTSVVPPMSKYYIYVPVLSKRPLEVDAQPFDRLVLTASSARNFQSYDIVSLYQYGKSLRQSLTINDVILSHGYGSTPSEVVVMIVAAYCVAASFRAESTEFFKRVTTQINSTRNNGLLSNLIQVATSSFLLPFKALLSASGSNGLFGVVDSKLIQAIDSLNHVTVSVSPSPPSEQLVVDTATSAVRIVDSDAVNVRGSLQPTAPPAARLSKKIPVLDRYEFYSVSVGKSAPRMLALSGCHAQSAYSESARLPDTVPKINDFILDLPTLVSYESTAGDYPTLCNQATVDFLSKNSTKFKSLQKPEVTKEGDYLFRQAKEKNPAIIVFRGLGRKVLMLKPPLMYNRSNITFCLRYDFDITDVLSVVVSGGDLLDLDQDIVQLARYLAGGRLPSFDPSPILPVHEIPSRTETVAQTESTKVASPTASVLASGSDVGDVASSFDVEVDGSDTFSAFDSATEPVLPSMPVGSESTPSAHESDVPVEVDPALPPGYNALQELRFMNVQFEKAVVSTCQSFEELAKAAGTDAAVRQRWVALSAALPSEPVVVQNDVGVLRDVIYGLDASYGGVCWNGQLVSTSDFLSKSLDGEYAVTSDDLAVFVVHGLDIAIGKYSSISYTCDVVLEDAPAANGKTHKIVSSATASDYIVCETRAACVELKTKLLKKDSRFSSRCFTVDSAIINDRVVDRVDVLYIDEALRLHAGKIYLLMRMLRPSIVMCYGDSNQIPSINFQAGYDYAYHKFPYTSVRVLSDSRLVIPCFAMALSSSSYYGRHILTHSGDTSYRPVREYYDESKLVVMAADRPDTVVLTYTKVAKADLRKLGITNAYTVGDVQGQRYDHVILVREKDINKVLYFDLAQTLTAVTRARKTVTYVSASVVDGSAMSQLIDYINRHDADVESHLIGSN